MSKRLIVATNSATATNPGRNNITLFLESKKWQVWHWFSDLWLVSDVPDDLVVNVLREELPACLDDPTKHILIFEIANGSHHTGWVPTSGIEWFKEHWKS